MTGYSLDSLLDDYSLDQIVMFYNQGFDWEEIKAIILVNKLIEAITGKKSKSPSKSNISDKPDLAKFYKIYGDKIKRKKGK
ncbi:hypothetical protein ES705_50427 [subsurface metagenome]